MGIGHSEILIACMHQISNIIFAHFRNEHSNVFMRIIPDAEWGIKMGQFDENNWMFNYWIKIIYLYEAKVEKPNVMYVHGTCI